VFPRFIQRIRASRVVCSLLAFTFPLALSFGADGKATAETLTPAEVFKQAVPGVVAIDCLGINNVKISTASGFIISDNGKIATNYHVIGSCESAAVRLTNGDVYDSTWVLATDRRRDLAIIKIKAASLPVLPLAESNKLEVGQTVYSIGNPSGLQNTLQLGLVSAFREVNGSRLVQISASLNPGNSGGPVLDDKGQVVAIAVSKIIGAENIGFAIPVDYLKGYLDSKEESAFSAFRATTRVATVLPVGNNDPGAAATWTGPVHSQLVSFSIPRTFKQVLTKSEGAVYASTWIPENETSDKWTKMVALLAGKGLASNRNLTPKLFAQGMAATFGKSCANSFTTSDLFEGKMSGRDAFMTVFSCAALPPPATSASVSIVIAAIKGDSDYYALEWGEREAATNVQAAIDKTIWLEKFTRLAPIKLCPIVPGETAPYASCINSNGKQAQNAAIARTVTATYPEPPQGDGTLARAAELAKAKRFSEAFSLFLESAKNGNTQAQRYVGDLYKSGLGVLPDVAQARQWYETAAAGGDSTAANTLGLLYYFGQGGAQDYAKARVLFEQSAKAGNAEGMLNAGNLCVSGKGGPQDYAQASRWYSAAAAAGNAIAMVELGNLYQRGQGVAQDYQQARLWYEKAAALGNAAALHSIGWLYLGGKGVPVDYALARTFFEKAAAGGYAASMSNIGYIYEHALGVAQDYGQARAWYEKAVAGGYTAAKANLEKMSQ